MQETNGKTFTRDYESAMASLVANAILPGTSDGPLGRTACVCGESRSTPIFRDLLPWLKRCRGCGLQFADPQPSDEELADIYRADYYTTFGCRDGESDSYHRMMRCRAERLLGAVERTFPVDRLLDVGSGFGDLLWVGRRRGWDARGVEPNAYAVDSAEQRLPGATFCGGIEEFDAEPERFDLITCLDVIEHLRAPDQVLKQFHAMLQPGGGLVISTVDAGSLSARLMGSRWPHYHRDHLWSALSEKPN